MLKKCDWPCLQAARVGAVNSRHCHGRESQITCQVVDSNGRGGIYAR